MCECNKWLCAVEKSTSSYYESRKTIRHSSFWVKFRRLLESNSLEITFTTSIWLLSVCWGRTNGDFHSDLWTRLRSPFGCGFVARLPSLFLSLFFSLHVLYLFENTESIRYFSFIYYTVLFHIPTSRWEISYCKYHIKNCIKTHRHLNPSHLVSSEQSKFRIFKLRSGYRWKFPSYASFVAYNRHLVAGKQKFDFVIEV